MAYKYFSLTLIVIGIAFLLYVRFAPTDPVRWHVDPMTAEIDGKPHHYRILPQGGDAMAPVYAVPADTLAQKFDEVVGDAAKVAGSLEERHITYEVRTSVLQYPDYISVKFLPLSAETSTIAIYSRSRFGYSDGGLNKRRSEVWIKALRPLQVGG